jgi:PPK2 family polyphosphate:nucleotide phosphotransferase
MKTQPVVITGRIKLHRFDPGYCGHHEKDATRLLTDALHRRIAELQPLLYANARHAVLLIFQGMDACGKDGSIRSVLQGVNPAGVETANFKVPSAEESAHDYLWRIHHAVPRRGDIGVFNRSHYESVLAERVLEIVPQKVWRPRYAEIVTFERFLAANNVVVLKFYLHLSRDEQAARFKERLANPKKFWKFAHADLTTRQHWDDYHAAYEDMLNATSQPAARWHLIPADRNWYRDYLIAATVVRALESLHLKWPKRGQDFADIHVK